MTIRHSWSLTLLTGFILILAGCKSEEVHGPPTAETSPTCADWGYGDHNGSESWGSLCSQTCKGEMQSPIDIETLDVVDQDLPRIAVAYHATSMDLSNNGHTIEAEDGAEQKLNSIEVNGETYELLQFHFHALSEHTIDGEHSPIEMHLVHRLSDTQLGVIGVMINEGAENSAFGDLWSQLPATKETPHIDVDVDLAALLPADLDYFNYPGSLTTPNGSNPEASCAEIVNWMVLKNSLEMSAEQIAAFQAIFDHNYRPVQPLNGRTVTG